MKTKETEPTSTIPNDDFYNRGYAPPFASDSLMIEERLNHKPIIIVGQGNIGKSVANECLRRQADVVILDEAKRNEAILPGRSSGMELTKQQLLNPTYLYRSRPNIEPSFILPEKVGERKPLTKKQRKARKAKRRIVKQSKRK